MVKLTATYDGNLRCTTTHGPSGAILVTDAPVDNHGKGESFSPTDLLAASMLTCIMTIVAIRADSKSISVAGMTGRIEKTMAPSPRRVSKLVIVINLPAKIGIEDRSWLIQEGCDCPICVSISQQMELDITFQ
ncbi:MAG: OsmC family protein [Candidatus Poseidoniales archaeon]